MNSKTIFAASLLATLLLGGGAAATAHSLVDVPARETFTVSTPVRQGVDTAKVHDPHDVLSADDEQRMLRDVQQLSFPGVVKQVHYVVFKENRSNVNDSVEEYLRDNSPELIGPDKYSDGVLIVGVGLDPRQAFIGAGEDVANLLALHNGDSHLEQSLDAIKPGVKDGNIPAGLIAGVREATDVEKLAETRYEEAEVSRQVATWLSGFGVGGSTLAAGGVLAALRRKREKRLAEARENLAFVSKEYGELAGRLDGIDIRANSLTSPLAHHTMRKQWAEVRDHFLQLHKDVDSFGNLTVSDDPKAILARAEQIEDAATTARQIGHAETNIDTLFLLEHGDGEVRKREVSDLRGDITQAMGTVSDTNSGLYAALSAAQREADALLASPETQDFVERYARLLVDYQSALATLKTQQLSDVKKPSSEPTAPAIYDANYRPGYGYADFVPYWALSSWHSSEIAAQEAASSASSGVNSTYSSGFSGAGGSSSF